MQELEGLAEDDGVKPPAAAGTGAQCDVEGDAHQAGADPRARHVLHEAVGHRLEDVGAAGAPQHCGVSCGEGVYMFSGNNVFTVCLSFAACTVHRIKADTCSVVNRLHASVEQQSCFHRTFFCTLG